MNSTKFFLSIENLIFFLLLFAALFLNDFHYDEALIYQRIENYINFNQFVDDNNVEITFGLFYKIFLNILQLINIFILLFIKVDFFFQ